MTNAIQGRALLSLYPRLRVLLEIPAFVDALKDDYWLDKVSMLMDMPDYTEGEDVRWKLMVDAVPELQRFAQPPRTDESPFIAMRKRAQCAAVRTIAIGVGLGNQTFKCHPRLGGETALQEVVLPGLSCRFGAVNSVTWRPTPSLITKAEKMLENTVLIETVALRLAPPGGSEEVFADWNALAPLRKWDEQHRAPLVYRHAEGSALTEGYVHRYQHAAIEAAGVPTRVASAISPLLAAAPLRECRLKFSGEYPAHDQLLAEALVRTWPDGAI